MFKQFRAENAKPDPRSTINSYRSFGYNLSTAIADIIDNCISAGAKNIWIDYLWAGKESSVTVTDDGSGMTLPELIIAMTPGSKDPESLRHENDLGRFGMGLKTASFSQCKRLTVSTKKDNISSNRCWDIDFINDQREWILLNYLSSESLIERISNFSSGTVIIWEKLDRIVGDTEADNEAVKRAFYQEFSLVKNHIAIVFHRFIEKKRISVFINDEEIAPWNPFLLDLDPKPEMGHTEVLKGKVNVTYYILPHMSRILNSDYHASGGPTGWHQQQGFYIYRADRLIVAGDWLGLEKKREYSKLARISIDFSNSKDFDWNLDIKKSTATPPVDIRKDLIRIAKVACLKSAQIYNWRGQKQLGSGGIKNSLQQLWFEEVLSNGIKKYRINKRHPLIKRILELDTNGKKLTSKVLDLIEENIPIELILYNQDENPAHHEMEKISTIPSDTLINLAKELYLMNTTQGIPAEIAASQIMSCIPFNQFPLLKEYLT